MSENMYARLAKYLDTLPIPYPATESGVEIRLLERWFSPEEVEIALAMRGYPEPLMTIAERLGMKPDSLQPVMDGMAKKGLIFRIAKGEKRLYNLVPLAEGMWEFHLLTNDKETLRDLREYIDYFMDKGWYGTKTTQHRIIPISQSVSAGKDIMSYDQAEAIIKAQKKIAVTQCICRKEQKMLGQGCNHPLEVCMAFGAGAYYYIDNGLGREISHDEALKILHEGMESGLVLQPANGQKAWNICMCCGCCCNLLKALKKMDKPASVAHTNFFALVSADECTSCGLCEERCPMGAITIDETAVIDTDRCIGCGVCVGACSFEAVRLIQKDTSKLYVPPADMMNLHMQIAKERGLL